jgi:hypothetical protein
LKTCEIQFAIDIVDEWDQKLTRFNVASFRDL